MLVYIVCEELFSPYKSDTLAYDRFLSLIEERDVDAVLIANATGQYLKEIQDFKGTYSHLVARIVESETPVKMMGKTYHLRSSGVVTPRREMIHAVDDTVCELTMQEDGGYKYQYLCLDLFDSEHFDSLAKQSAAKQIVIPFQDIMKFLEQNMDDETAELLKKAKADFYYKTKS